MKKITISLVILVVLAALVFWAVRSNRPEGLVDSDQATHTMTSGDLKFTYQSGQEGYHLEETKNGSENNSEFIESVTLTPTEDYEDQKGRVGGESSPSLSLSVYKNTLNQSANLWIDSNVTVSGKNQIMGARSEVVVAGANAVSYTIDGLYPTKVTVIASNGYIYLALGSYLDTISKTYKDYGAWLESFEFVPPGSSTANAKIDIKVACESALAYTTFMSGEDADKFVAECVAGGHPDVVERYIKTLGADGSAI